MFILLIALTFVCGHLHDLGLVHHSKQWPVGTVLPLRHASVALQIDGVIRARCEAVLVMFPQLGAEHRQLFIRGKTVDGWRNIV